MKSAQFWVNQVPGYRLVVEFSSWSPVYSAERTPHERELGFPALVHVPLVFCVWTQDHETLIAASCVCLVVGVCVCKKHDPTLYMYQLLVWVFDFFSQQFLSFFAGRPQSGRCFPVSDRYEFECCWTYIHLSVVTNYRNARAKCISKQLCVALYVVSTLLRFETEDEPAVCATYPSPEQGTHHPFRQDF